MTSDFADPAFWHRLHFAFTITFASVSTSDLRPALDSEYQLSATSLLL